MLWASRSTNSSGLSPLISENGMYLCCGTTSRAESSQKPSTGPAWAQSGPHDSNTRGRSQAATNGSLSGQPST
eukprot:scaffold590555_cov33-Prasinocladus_malaysianus.AAC.1